MSRFGGFPNARITWRTRLVNRLFGRKRTRSVAIGRTRDKMALMITDLHSGAVIASIWITKAEAVILAEEIDKHRGLLDITS